jgi:hypothetical protein
VVGRVGHRAPCPRPDRAGRPCRRPPHHRRRRLHASRS